MNNNPKKKKQIIYQVTDLVIEEQRRLRKSIMEKMLTLATSAFGLVAALAWNDAVKGLFEKFFGPEKEQLAAKLWYALLVTVLAVIVTIYLSRLAGEDNTKNKKKPK